MQPPVSPITPAVDGAAAASPAGPVGPDRPVPALVARRPGLAAALMRLAENLRRAGPEDRAFVLSYLESLAARFRERPGCGRI